MKVGTYTILQLLLLNYEQASSNCHLVLIVFIILQDSITYTNHVWDKDITLGAVVRVFGKYVFLFQCPYLQLIAPFLPSIHVVEFFTGFKVSLTLCLLKPKPDPLSKPSVPCSASQGSHLHSCLLGSLLLLYVYIFKETKVALIPATQQASGHDFSRKANWHPFLNPDFRL